MNEQNCCFFVYDLELFIDACVYKRYNSTMQFLVVKIDMRRSPKMSVPTATREEPAVNFDLFICNYLDHNPSDLFLL